MVTLPLIAPDCYLIDCSSIMAFSGADYAAPDRYLARRESIWIHLEEMIACDRLKTVSQVWKELEFLDKGSFNRLRPSRNKFILPADDDTEFKVLNLISKYPNIIDYRLHYTREQQTLI